MMQQLQLIRKMGNQQANDNNLSLTNQQREDWIKIEDQGYCQLWANKKTNKRFQAYPISDAIAKDNVQLQKYAFRKIHNAYLVSAEAVITQNQTFLCSVPATSFVLIQNIVTRLKAFTKSFTFEESLYVLSSSASGYNTLCSFFGPLEPNEDMICFNDAGCVKVWLNENLSKNQASPNARSVEYQMPKVDDSNFAERRSRECVEKLLKIVQNSTIQGFPREFKEETKKFSTFFQISNFVDYFCMLNRIQTLDHLELRREPTLITGTIQSKVANGAISIPIRIQPVQSLQSSRVNQVFHSNYQRQGLSPVVIAPLPQQQLIGSPQIRPQIIPQTAPWIQNHQVSYVYNPAPPPQPQIISTPIIRVNPNPILPPAPPVPQELIQIKTNNYQPAQAEQRVDAIQQNVIEKVHSQLIQPIQQQVPQIISTPEEQHQIVLPYEGSLNKEDAYINQSQSPQFYEEHTSNNFNNNNLAFNLQQNIQTNYQRINEKKDNFEEENLNHNSFAAIIHQQPEHHQYQTKSVEEDYQPPQQNIYQQEYYQQEYHQEKQPNAQSIYSNIEQYVPPQQTYIQEPIEEKRQEYIVSPQKQNQIDQWSQKLDNFTNLKERVHAPPKIQIYKPEIKVYVETKEPQSFKNLIVSDKKQEYVNELADLENDDIEKYIRTKYQAYLKEQSEPQPESNDIQYNRQPQPQAYRPKYQSYRSNQYQQEETSNNDYYKPTEYEYKYQQKWQSNAPYEKDYESNNYRNIYQTQQYPSNNNRISIEQEFQQDYTSSRRNQPSKYGSKYNNQAEEDNYNQYGQYNITRNRESQRRGSSRNSNIIDQKYNKYVLNSQKPKRPAYNLSNSEDVSLILPGEESNFIKQTPKPILQKSFEHDSFSYNKPSAKKGITYEKLRNLLWEQ